MVKNSFIRRATITFSRMTASNLTSQFHGALSTKRYLLSYSKNVRILWFITVFNYSMPMESTLKRMTPLHILPDDNDDNRHHNLLLPRITLSPVLVPHSPWLIPLSPIICSVSHGSFWRSSVLQLVTYDHFILLCIHPFLSFTGPIRNYFHLSPPLYISYVWIYRGWTK
jgi:hypothetical protein